MWRSFKIWLYNQLSGICQKFQVAEKNRKFEKAKREGLVTVGAYSYGTPLIISFPGDKNRVRIGSYCSIADDVTIFVGGNHRADWITTFPIRLKLELVKEPEQGILSSKGDVVIGSDVWIGYGATILSGVEIGHGAVIGARTVVTKPVPPYAIVAGNPGRVVGKRFSENQIGQLLSVKWWDWPAEKVIANVELLCSDEIDGFCRLYGLGSGEVN